MSPGGSEDRKRHEFLQCRIKWDSMFGYRDEQLPCCIWQAILAVFLVLEQLRVHPGFTALGDVHSNSYRLPPAVQSVLLQWTLLLRAAVFVVLLDKTERPRPLCHQWAWLLVQGVCQVFIASYFRWLLAQFELEGWDLHGIQADGGVVSQRRAGVHQGERHGLEQLQVQILEQSWYAQLQREKGRKSNNIRK